MTPLLVTASTIKTYGVLENNVDVKLINSTTLMIQDIQLQQILGTDLYNQICDQINASTVNTYDAVSAANITLLNDYITNFLMNAVIAEGCLTFLYRFSNKGIITANSDNQFPITEAQLDRIIAKWQNQADFYAKRLSDYLDQESATYPLYYNGNSDSSDINPKIPKYNTGFYLGNKRRQNEYKKLWPYCKDC